MIFIVDIENVLFFKIFILIVQPSFRSGQGSGGKTWVNCLVSGHALTSNLCYPYYPYVTIRALRRRTHELPAQVKRYRATHAEGNDQQSGAAAPEGTEWIRAVRRGWPHRQGASRDVG